MISLVYRIVHLQDSIGVHATLVDDNGDILAITKYPVGPRNSGKGLNGFLDETAKFAEDCKNNPPITNWIWGAWDYIFINGWDEEIVTDKDLLKSIGIYGKNS